MGTGKAGRRSLLDFLVLSLGEGLSKVMGFFAFAHLARALHADDYGAVEFAASFAALFTSVVDFGLGKIAAREIAKDPSKAPDYAAWVIALRGLMVLVAVPAMILAAYLTGQPRDTLTVVALFAVGLAGVALDQRWLFQGLERMRPVSLAQLVRMTAFFVAVMVVVKHEGDLVRVGLSEIFAAGAMGAYCLIAQRWMQIRPRLAFPRAELIRLARESVPLGLTQMLGAFNQSLPTLVVGAIAGGLELGYFGSANRIYASLAAFSIIYHFNLFPTYTQTLQTSRAAFDALVGSSFRLISWTTAAAALGGTVAAPALCKTVFGPGFDAAALPLSILLWALPIIMASGHARWGLLAAGHQDLMLRGQIAGTVATVIICAALVPPYGAEGAAVGLIASNLVTWLVSDYLFRQRVGPLPLWGFLKPLGTAAAVGAVAIQTLGRGWTAGIAAGVTFVLLALVVERRLPADVRRLGGKSAPSKVDGD
jgi:O-antigen/teichoic acid export membrane protein